MITGLKVDNSAYGALAPSSGSKEGSKNSVATRKADQGFADQLLEAKSDRLESPDRKERKTPGREYAREGNRSTDRDRDSRESSDVGTPKGELKKRSAKRDDEIESRSPASQSVSPNIQTHEPPIVVEAPKGEEELRLPDFFSQNSLKGTVEKAPLLTADSKVATAQTADMLTLMKDAEALSRQSAMAEFLSQMESGLGVPPENILQAFSELDPQALAASPEASASQFLDGLGLQGEAREMAGELYNELLDVTGDSILNEKVAGLDADVNFEVLSSRDANLKKLNTSLDSLNTSFFRKDSGLANEPQKAQAALESMDAALAKIMLSKQESMASAGALGAGAVSAQQASPVDADLFAQELPQEFAELSEADAESVSLLAGEKEVTSSFAKDLAKEDSDFSSSSQDSGADASTEAFADAEVSTSTPFASALAQPAGKAAAVLGPADMMMNRQPTSADEQANVRDLIKNAQLMVKRGGGEMNIEMTPEGMGKVHLKVAVENGQVNVQMLTESDQAKRLLEKGMHELRTTLAANDLRVENLRVDVGSDIQKQMGQEATQDQARQQARQFAQDFMGSFRDQNQGFRQGLMEQGGWRSYGRNQRREAMNPEVSSSVSAASGAKSNDGSKRLNLVA